MLYSVNTGIHFPHTGINYSNIKHLVDILQYPKSQHAARRVQGTEYI
jgi:hypothetical protein